MCASSCLYSSTTISCGMHRVFGSFIWACRRFVNIFYKALGNFAEFSLVALGNKYELIEILRLKYQRSRSRPDQIQKGVLVR